jgi:hypothetical protein
LSGLYKYACSLYGKVLKGNGQEALDTYFQTYGTNGSSLGEVLTAVVTNNKKVRDKRLLFEGNGSRGYVEVDYSNSTPMDQYAYVRNTKVMVITHVMIEPRGNKQIEKAVQELFEQTDVGAVVIQSIILDSVMDHFEAKGWTVDRETRNATIKRPDGKGVHANAVSVNVKQGDNNICFSYGRWCSVRYWYEGESHGLWNYDTRH